MYYILNKSCPKGTGSDGLPGWFFKFISPAICEPLSTIYNNCIKQAFFPAQWKHSIIHPIKKINNPTQPNQYRPISITPILSRILEKYIDKDHIYPCLTNLLVKSRFDDQFAFRPTGSPTSSIIYLTSVITFFLTSNKFIRFIVLDFLRHSTLSIILFSSLRWPHYNLMIVLITYSFHFLKTEPILQIFTVKHLVPYLLILACFKVRYWVHHFSLLTHLLLNLYILSMQLELDSLAEWAKLSNLFLNLKKSYELIIQNNYNKIPPPSLHSSPTNYPGSLIHRKSQHQTSN